MRFYFKIVFTMIILFSDLQNHFLEVFRSLFDFFLNFRVERDNFYLTIPLNDIFYMKHHYIVVA